MERDYLHNRDPHRQQLHRCEQSRRDSRQRELFWENGERWLHCLEQLVERENASDHAFRIEIDEARAGSETQLRLEEQWQTVLADDRKWHENLLANLRQLDQLWQSTRNISQDGVDELRYHCFRIELRLTERKIVYHQLGIEMLERRRRSKGTIKSVYWREHWDALAAAFDRQISAYPHESSEVLRNQRLAWASQVYAMQENTLQAWGQQGNVDKAGLRANMAQVERLIADLSSQETGSGGRWVFALIIVLGIIVGIGSAVNNATHNSEIVIEGVARPVASTPRSIQAAAMPIGDQKALNKAGVELLRQGYCDAAILQFQAAYDADPTAYAAYEPLNNAAFCFYDLGRIDEAIAKWQQALAIEPNSPDANAGLGLALYVAGQQDEGLIFYSKALGLQAGYLDEAYLSDSVFWSVYAIETSRPLRERLGP